MGHFLLLTMATKKIVKKQTDITESLFCEVKTMQKNIVDRLLASSKSSVVCTTLYLKVF